MSLLVRLIDNEVSDRFWSRVRRSGASECWPWLGSTDRYGYGSFYLRGHRQASRVALVLATKSEPPDRAALHSCDNPSCCNPAHLRWGSVADNMADKVQRGRARGRFSAPVRGLFTPVSPPQLSEDASARP